MTIMKPQLFPGEEICPDCKGEGHVESKKTNMAHHCICLRCWGVGKLDWVSMAMKKEVNPYDTITIPLVRKLYPKLIAEELAGIDPVNLKGSEEDEK